MKPGAVIATLLAFLALAAGLAWWIWRELGDVAMSWHGFAALALGALFSFAIGAGLMFLVFYSNRHGHDDIERRD